MTPSPSSQPSSTSPSPTHKILIVDDEENLRNALKDFMESEGFDVSTAGTGPEGLRAAVENQHDVIILDIMLPDINGFDVCKMLRNDGINTPIIMLTAKGEEIDKILGLEMGADDYMTKPFSSRELLARVRAILRRSQNTNGDNKENKKGQYQFGHNRLNTVHQELTCKNVVTAMTRKEYDLLVFMISQPNQVISRNDILEAVWGYDSSPTTRTVDTHILSLRQKIETDPSSPTFIITVHGRGYRFVLAD